MDSKKVLEVQDDRPEEAVRQASVKAAGLTPLLVELRSVLQIDQSVVAVDWVGALVFDESLSMEEAGARVRACGSKMDWLVSSWGFATVDLGWPEPTLIAREEMLPKLDIRGLSIYKDFEEAYMEVGALQKSNAHELAKMMDARILEGRANRAVSWGRDALLALFGAERARLEAQAIGRATNVGTAEIESGEAKKQKRI